MRISDWSSDVCSSDLDGYGGIDVQSWTVTVTRPNGKPITTDDVHAVHIGQQLVVGAPEGVLSNDTDPDGDALTAAVVSQPTNRSEEHTSELQSLMRTSYAVFCLKKKKTKIK